MGCGCNKKSTNPVANAQSASTVYQVLASDRSVQGEYGTIQEARAKAAELSPSGSVRVATKRS